MGLYGVEAGGKGIKSGKHSASLAAGSEGILHGMFTRLLQDDCGQVIETHSISAGLDYPVLARACNAQRGQTSKIRYVYRPGGYRKGFIALSRLEGIIPALEPSHALSYAMKLGGGNEKG